MDMQEAARMPAWLSPLSSQSANRHTTSSVMQVSLQTLPSTSGGLPDILGLPGSGSSLQNVGALLAARLLDTQQELSSALSVLRSYTTKTPASSLSAAPRYVCKLC